MLKSIFNNKLLNAKPSNSVIGAAFIITSAGLASRLLGLFRDRLLAATFGAGDTLDIYYAAFRIPDLIYNLLILGALSAAFIPVFTGLISREKEDEAWHLANGILNLAIFFIIALSIILCVLASQIQPFLTPGFGPEKMEKVVVFTRIMFLSPLFLGMSGVFGGILTSFRRFLVYSIAPILYNLGIMIGITVFVRVWGEIGLAWGVVLGAIGHMLIQYIAARNLGFRHQFDLKASLANEDIRKVFKLMIPRTLGIAINQINLLVITFFASTLAVGSLAIFTLAQNLQGVPIGLVGSSFAIAVFPSLAAYASKNEDENFISSFSETIRQIFFFVIPLSVFILLLRAQIVRVFYGAGRFNWEDTVLTVEVLEIFTLSLFAQCVTPLLARSFYALQDTKTPFYIALVAEAVSIGLALALVDQFQLVGLAIAFSVSAIIQMLLLLFVLRSRFEHFDDRRIIRSVVKISTASFLSGLAIQAAKHAINRSVNIDTFLGIFFQLSFSIFAGLVVFIAVCHILQLEEYINFRKSLTKRLWRSKKVIVENTTEVSGI